MARMLYASRVSRPRPVGRDRLLGMIMLVGSFGWAGAALAQGTDSTDARSVPAGEGSEPVARLQPAEIYRLRQQLTILGARQKIETSRQDCLDRGGEVIDPRVPAAEPSDEGR